MGILDLPAPVLYFLDNTFDFLPDVVRLAFWSVLGGALSMAFYALISPQAKISRVKVALREAQGLLARSDESFAELRLLVKRTLSLACQHLMLVFVPALVSSLPLICILVWASSQFGYQFPTPGETISVSVRPAAAAPTLHWMTDVAGYPRPEYSGPVWTVAWPDAGHSLTLGDGKGNQLLRIPPSMAIPQIHKRVWWNSVLGNPLGYLPQHSPVDGVALDLPARQYLPMGPAWLRGWLAFFVIAATFSALTIKWLFRVH